jgi:hypothetical protein
MCPPWSSRQSENRALERLYGLSCGMERADGGRSLNLPDGSPWPPSLASSPGAVASQSRADDVLPPRSARYATKAIASMINADISNSITASRRAILVGGTVAALASVTPRIAAAESTAIPPNRSKGRPVQGRAALHDAHCRIRCSLSIPASSTHIMETMTTKDGVEIFCKDWGRGQPIVFHHDWPLSSDDWDAQMLFFAQHGNRVVGFDRRGHGRSSQVPEGHDMNHYAADAAAVVEHLDLRDAVHIGHSTGGGVVARYVARHGKGRVAKAVLMSAVTPIMVKTPSNPGGLPIEVFDGLRNGLAANRAQFYRDVPSGPFYGFNRPRRKAARGRDPELVATGYDGLSKGPLRWN